MVKAALNFGFLVLLGLGVALSASAQGRGFSAPMRGFSAPARSVSRPMRGMAQRGMAQQSSSGLRRGLSRTGRLSHGGFTNGNCGVFASVPCPTFFPPPITATPQNPNFGLINGVPGLGFDFPHLAAINRPFNSQGGFLTGAGFNNGFFGNGFGFIPFFGSFGGYYPPYEEEETPEYYAEGGHQPIFVVPSPQQSTGFPPAQTAPPAQAVAPQIPPTPPPELGQLILVRSDGQVLLAVAFTTNHGQLTYITREGTRRSFPVSELDKDATRQMNDANGTSVSLPQ